MTTTTWINDQHVRCPHCGACPAGGESLGATVPKAGDFTACLRCGIVLRFVGAGAGLGLAAATEEELDAAGRAQPWLFFGLMLLRRLIERAEARRRAAMN